MSVRTLLRSLRSDRAGTMVIETAIIAPVLIVMCLGTFEVSSMIAKQGKLQSTAEQAVEIAVASSPTTDAERAQVETELESSSGLTGDNVQVAFKFRCGTDPDLTDTQGTCDDDQTSQFLLVTLHDEYVPVWTQWGFGQPFSYDETRSVQVS